MSESTQTYASGTPLSPVADPSSLSGLLERLDAAPAEPVSLDTEADSFHHYREKVCLIQVGIGAEAWLVDPLAGLDLSPLLARLSGRRLLLHGADYDLRLLHRGYGFRASSLFDTMLAAQLLGEGEIGLAALVKKRFGVELDKSSQRADWSLRPLSPELVAYAASDVLHLPELAAALEADLIALGRLEWHAEECARLAAAPFSPRERDPENDWRVKGTNALRDRERAFFRELWLVREQRAEALDVAPFRVYPGDPLLRAARLAAAGDDDPKALFPSSRPLPQALLSGFQQAVERARQVPQSAWPSKRHGERVAPDAELEAVVTRLKTCRDARARELGLDPGVLGSRSLLADAARALLAAGAPLDAEALEKATGMSRWRAALLAPCAAGMRRPR